MNESFTVRVITPTCTREHHNVATIGHQTGPLGFIALKNPDNKVIAFYKDSAYSAWYVVQEQPVGNSTGAHLHFDARDAFPRDELGRFVKRR